MSMRYIVFFVLLIAYCTDVLAQDHGFTRNEGQFPVQVKFDKEIPSGRFFAEANGFTYHLVDFRQLAEKFGVCNDHRDEHASENHKHGVEKLSGHVVKVRFVNMQLPSSVNGLFEKNHLKSFFIGNDPSNWISGVKSFGRISYENVFRGVDLVLYEQQKSIKYDFIVHPFQDPHQIRLQIDGADSVFLRDGQLVIATTIGEIVEDRPFVYQRTAHGIDSIAAEFYISGQTISFKLNENWNKSLPLIIDPSLIFSTYSGSTGLVSGDAATYDQAGNLYTSGGMFSTGYPTTAGAYQTAYTGTMGGWQMVVSKYNASGTSLLYATYIGGTTSSGGGGGMPGPPPQDYPLSLYVDGNNSLLVLGTAQSSNFPTTAGCFDNSIGGSQDYVVFKLNSTGTTLQASTYLGGSNDDGGTFQSKASGIFIDGSNNIYVAGTTNSTNFPGVAGSAQGTIGGGYDGVVAKLNNNLTSVLWSSYLGGSGDDNASDVKINAAGDVFVCGNTSSTNFPGSGGLQSTNSGNQDGFVVRLNSSGTSLLNRTFLGTAQKDKAKFLQLDLDGDVYVLGATNNSSYSTTPGVYSSAGQRNYFVHKLSPNLGTTLYSTCVGGNQTTVGSVTNEFFPTAFGIDECENVYFTGNVLNGGFPMTSDAYTQTVRGLYICALKRDAVALIYGSYFGGDIVTSSNTNGSHYHETSNCRYDDAGVLYHTECTLSSSYPLLNQYSSKQNQSSNDAASFKFDFYFAVDLDTIEIGPDTTILCASSGYTLDASGYNAVEYLWSTGDTTSSITVSVTDEYWVMIYNACDTIYDTVNVTFLPPFNTSYTTVPANCSANDGSATITVIGGSGSPAITWLAPATGSQTLASGLPSGPVSVIITDNGCTDTVNIIIPQVGSLTAQLDSTHDVSCFGFSDGEAFLSVTSGTAPFQFVWSGSSSIASSANDLASGNFQVFIEDSLGCLDTLSGFIGSPTALLADTVSQSAYCNQANGSATVIVSGGVPAYAISWSGLGISTAQANGLLPGTYTVSVTDANACQVQTTISVGNLPPPLASFNTSNVCLNEAASFLPSVSIPSGSPIINYQWNFGDGLSSQLMEPLHMYNYSGIFQVELIVTDSAGCSDTSIAPIEVYALPSAFFSVDSSACPPLTLQLSDQSTGASTWNWMVTGGFSSSSQTALFTFTQPGLYDVTLVVTNAFGCADTMQVNDSIEVYPVPLSDFTASPLIALEWNPLVSFENQASGNITWSWDLGDGTSSQDLHVDHLYSDTGHYEVCLFVENEFGCVDTSCQTVWIKPDWTFYVPNAFTPNNDGKNEVFQAFASNISAFEMIIFNRWGEVIYTSNDISLGWDGSHQGEKVKQDVYVWQISFKDYDGRKRVERGHVTLIR